MNVQIGIKYTPLEIMAYCNKAGKFDLVRRINKHKDQLNDFISDGCTMWPDEWRNKKYTHCCLIHDIEYWVGGTEDERFLADCRLAMCVTKRAGYRVAEAMFMGVRAGNVIGQFFKPGWEWGYGRR